MAAVLHQSTADIIQAQLLYIQAQLLSIQAQQNDETSNETSNGIESSNSIMRNRRRIEGIFYPSTHDMHIQQHEQLTKIDYR